MKVLLTGATMGTNFGDFLFAKLFYDTVCEINGKDNTYYYESKLLLSDFFKKYMGYDKERCKLKDMDALVYISGGYFCGDDKGLKDYIIRFFRYFYVGLYFVLSKKPIALFGVDVGRFKSKIMQKTAAFILRHAKVISVRNKESVECLKDYNLQVEPYLTSDTAQVLGEDYGAGKKLPLELDNTKKYLFFHIFTNIEKNKKTVYKLINPISEFLEKNKEYQLIIGCDQYESFEDEVLQDIKAKFGDEAIIYKYEDPIEFFELLRHMDLVVTPKLHVGIVSCSMSKPVISFSVHTDKISRYYEQIGEAGRTMPLEKATKEIVLRQLDTYKDVPVNIDKEIRELANKNLTLMKDFILGNRGI